MRASTLRVPHVCDLRLGISLVLLITALGVGCSTETSGANVADTDLGTETGDAPATIDTGQDTTDTPSPADTAGEDLPPLVGCVPEDEWCPAGPWGDPDHFQAVQAFGEDEVWLVGHDRPVLRWDGAELIDLGDGLGKTWLNGIWGTDPSNVWVCGHGGFVAHWNGTTWTAHETGVDATLWGIWGAGDGQIWAVGAQGTVIHFDGTTWDQATLEDDSMNLDSMTLRGIWGASADDLWVVGSWGWEGPIGVVYRWNGEAWTKLPLSNQDGTGGGFGAVWGSGPDDVWITAPGTMDFQYDMFELTQSIHWNGAEWSEVDPGVDGLFTRVHGSGPDDVWLTGQGGVAHWDGQGWDLEETPADGGYVAAWSPDLAWMTGEDGALYQWDGSGWSHVVWPVPDLTTVAGTGDTIWSAGTYGTVISHSGDGWSVEHPGAEVDLQSVWLDENGRPWVAGAEGTVLRQVPGGWEEIGPGGEDTLYGIWGSSTDDVWVVGGTSPRKSWSSDPGEGFVLRWDGATWEPVDTPLTVTGYAVAGTSPDDVWIVGAQRDPVHWDGADWTAVPLPYEALPEHTALLDIAVDPDDRVWVSGNWIPLDIETWTGIIAWLEDGEWLVFETGLNNDVPGIWSDGAHAVGAGQGHEVWTWTGDDFTFEELGKKGLRDVFGQPGGSVWVVGGEGHVYRRNL